MTTAFHPFIAAPTAMPTMALSLMLVSRMRLSPNSSAICFKVYPAIFWPMRIKRGIFAQRILQRSPHCVSISQSRHRSPSFPLT